MTTVFSYARIINYFLALFLQFFSSQVLRPKEQNRLMERVHL